MPHLSHHPLHLGLGATAEPQPTFTGGPWYEAYSLRTATDGAEGRLVSQHTFTEPWTMGELHPHGHEVVLCTHGAITLHQGLLDGTVTTVTLGPGEYAVNPPGVWHTADVDGEATAVFITAGLGTQHRHR